MTGKTTAGAANGQMNAAGQPRRGAPGGLNLAEQAYDQLEAMIVTCRLPPGRFLSIQDLQACAGTGRTPVHQAVTRLANDTLVLIRPRHGLQIAPIDLDRERGLLPLRRDMERFVVRLATERARPLHRSQLLRIGSTLRSSAQALDIAAFNRLDRRIDALLCDAAGEPFLEHTLRPLHTIFRRIGWIYHHATQAEEGLTRTIECHLAVLKAVAGGRVEDAVVASDQLIDFSDSMFDVIAAEVDPALLDCNLALQDVG